MARLNARSGIARAGATRSGDYWPKQVIVTIAGTNRSNVIEQSSIEIVDDLYQAVNVCRCTIKNIIPTYGQAVVVSLGSTDHVMFTGTIQRWALRPRARQIDDYWVDLLAVDATWDLDKRLVWATFSSTSVDDIISVILRNFCDSDFHNTQYVQTGITPTVTITFTAEHVSSALDRLADAVGADWYVDRSKRVHFFLTENMGTAPATLNSTTIYPWCDFTYSVDGSQLRTRVYVEGAGTKLLVGRAPDEAAGEVQYSFGTEGLSTAGLYHKRGSASDFAFSQTYGFAVESTEYSPGIFSETSRWRVGTSLYRINDVGAVSSAQTGVLTTVNGATSAGATTITLNDNIGPLADGYLLINGQLLTYRANSSGTYTGIPASGEGSIVEDIPNGAQVCLPAILRMDTSDVVAERHAAGDPVNVVHFVNDTVAQATYGYRESYHQDRRLGTDGCSSYLLAELALYAAPRETLRYRTRDPHVRSGASVTIDLTNPTLTGTFVIHRVTWTFNPEETGPNQLPWGLVDASNQQQDFYSFMRRFERQQR